MKSKIVLSLVPLIAAVLTGCDNTPDQQVHRACLDPNQNVVDAQKCEAMYDNHGKVNGFPYWYYYWYYTNGSYRPVPGSRVIIVPGRMGYTSGSFSAPEGAAFGRGASVGSVSRGGFGSSAHGSAGE